jgi:RNA polymerase sigma-70 factor, ECF subfamily
MNKREAPRARSYMKVESAPKPPIKLGPDIKVKIGQHLRALYSDVVNPGVPDRFSEILRRLDQADERPVKMRGQMAPPDKPVRAVMLAAVPSLRAFAISLCGNVDHADDFVQEVLLRAWANLDSFEPGANMSAWLFTILRNLFRSEYRKRRREVEDAEGSYAESLTSLPNQASHLEMDEFRRALELLPTDQRESLILVGASGFSYEEAAKICGCAVGTIKSRVNRARSRLAVILSIESADDFGPDHETRAAVGTATAGWRRS